MMISDFFVKKAQRRTVTPQARGLERLKDYNVSSANCTLLTTASGQELNEDIGRVEFFQSRSRLLVADESVFLSLPDGHKAEDRDHFQGQGESLRLWFLHERIPRVVDVVVEERVHLKGTDVPRLIPQSGVGFRVRLSTDVDKQDNRDSLRFSHRPGAGAMPVYPQILFDVFAMQTNIRLPREGAIPPWIEDLSVHPVSEPRPGVLEAGFSAEALVARFKDAMRGNPVEDRQVHISKPYLDERMQKGLLLELGYSGVLGLASEEEGPTLHIKKPALSWTKNRRDPHHLKLGDILILHYGSRSPFSGAYDYFQMITEITKDGLENMTIRPAATESVEGGMRVGLIDFSMNGFRFAATPEFIKYVAPESAYQSIHEQFELLQQHLLLFAFYPKLRFSPEVESHRPALPKRISVLGQIVRSDIDWEDEEQERGRFRTFGIKMMYDPVEYVVDEFRHSRWEMIRPFKENRYFKEVHKALNGLIAALESQAKEEED